MTKYILAASAALFAAVFSIGPVAAQSGVGLPSLGTTARKPSMGGFQLPPLVGMRPGTEESPLGGAVQPAAAPMTKGLPFVAPLSPISLSNVIDVENDMLVVENLSPGPFRFAIKGDPENADVGVSPGKYVVRRCRRCVDGAVILLFNDTKEDKEVAGKLRSVFSISWNPTTGSFAVASNASPP